MAETINRQRNLPGRALIPLAGLPGAGLINLQLGVLPPPELAAHDPMPQVRDLADTAAIVAGLDAVVSVDTAVAHLAASLGRPVLLLDRYDNCWRWLSDRRDSPWYPTVSLCRQTRPGDWSGPVAEAAALLRRMTVAGRL